MMTKLDLGLTVRLVRLFDILTGAFNSYLVVRGCWYATNQALVAVEYNGRVRWLGKVVPLP
jgi:hypothetical protein